jgi:hypothetical protein
LCRITVAPSCGVTIRQQNGTDTCIHGRVAKSTGRKEVRVVGPRSGNRGRGRRRN